MSKLNKYQLLNEEGIKDLVDRFYVGIRQDAKLAPVFEKAIGSTAEAWQPHLERMYSFWSSVMLGSATFSGNPLEKHMNLPFFEEAFFDRWLELFSEVCHQTFEEGIAVQFIDRSQRISNVFRSNMYR